MGTEQLCAPLQAGHCACPPGQTQPSFANWPGGKEQATFVGAQDHEAWGWILALCLLAAKSSSPQQGQQPIYNVPGLPT